MGRVINVNRNRWGKLWTQANGNKANKVKMKPKQNLTEYTCYSSRIQHTKCTVVYEIYFLKGVTNLMHYEIRYSCRKPSPTPLESVVEAVGRSYTHCRKDKFVVLCILTQCDVLMLMCSVHKCTSCISLMCHPFTWNNGYV